MKIRKAIKRDKKEAIKIAKQLKKWFTKDAINNMKVDFSLNNLIVAYNKNKVIGFLCYSSEQGVAKILWMGVNKEYHRQGIGRLLLNQLLKKARKINSSSIEVKTLAEKEDYKPYELTRSFYKKHGFKKIYTEKARIKGWDNQDVLERKIK